MEPKEELVEFGFWGRIGQDLRRLSVKTLGVLRSVQKYPNEVCKVKTKSRRDLDILRHHLEERGWWCRNRVDHRYRHRTDRTSLGRPKPSQVQLFEDLGELCKYRTRYGQAVRTIDCTSPGPTKTSAILGRRFVQQSGNLIQEKCDHLWIRRREGVVQAVPKDSLSKGVKKEHLGPCI